MPDSREEEEEKERPGALSETKYFNFLNINSFILFTGGKYNTSDRI